MLTLTSLRCAPIVVSTITLLGAASILSAAEPPADNPVASYYTGDEGYPAWTNRIHWDRIIDMSE